MKQPKNYSAIVNGKEYFFNDEQISGADIIRLNKNTFNIILDYKSYTLNVSTIDYERKIIKIEFNSQIYSVEIKTELDHLLRKIGFGASAGKKANRIYAPMPGLILEIPVKENDDLKEGEKVMVIEAMKMENIITMPADGKIKKINVEQGDAVSKGQILIEIGN